MPYNNSAKNPPSRTTWKQFLNNMKNYSELRKDNPPNHLHMTFVPHNNLPSQKNRIMQKLLNFLNLVMFLESIFRLLNVISMIIIFWLSHLIFLFRRIRRQPQITRLPFLRIIKLIRRWIWRSCWCEPERVWVVRTYRNKLISLIF